MRLTKFVFIFFFLIAFDVFSAKWYINDASTTGDVYCTAVGNASNSGTARNSPKLTIASILASVASGDEIYVDAGNYTENSINFASKNLKIYGAGTDLTIYDNSSANASFDTYNASSYTLVLNDLTIKNYTFNGGGQGVLFTLSSSYNLTFNNVVVSNCGRTGSNSRATILVSGSGNLTVNGGGFFCNGSSTTPCGAIEVATSATGTLSVSNAIFYNNYKSSGCLLYYGAAITIGSVALGNATCSASISNCFFYNNTVNNGGAAGYGGSAIFVHNSTGTCSISNCVFNGNTITNQGTSTMYGGVCHFRSGTITISGTLFDSNNSGTVVGTLATYGAAAAVTISNSKFISNSATTTTDMYCYNAGSSINASHCTISLDATRRIEQALGTFTIANCGNPTRNGSFIVTNTNAPNAFSDPTVPSYTGNCTVSLSSSIVTVTASSGTAGPTGYPNLRLALAAINGGVHRGNVVVMINSSTTETATASLYATGVGSASYSSVNIYPTAISLSVTGSLSGSSILALDAATNVTLHGGLNGSGTSSLLTISNTASAAASNRAILIQNNAGSNTIKYCTIKANNSSTTNSTAGILFIGDGAAGNISNTIDNCTITFETTSTKCLLVSYNSSGGTANSATVSNNFFTGFANHAIWCSTKSSGFTITNNQIYSSIAGTGGSYLIYLDAGTSYDVNNNILGGSVASYGGSTYFAPTSGDVVGVYIGSITGAGTNYVRNNSIKYLKATSNNPYAVKITATTSTTLYIKNNSIAYINNNTSGNNSWGLYATGACTSLVLHINANSISNLTTKASGNAETCYGMDLVNATGLTSCYIYNNYIKNKSATYRAYGITTPAVATNIYYNTIEIYSSAASAAYEQYGIRASEVYSNDVKNNIISLTSTNSSAIYCVIQQNANSSTAISTHSYNYYYVPNGSIYSQAHATWGAESTGQQTGAITFNSNGSVATSVGSVAGAGTNLSGASPSIITDIINISRASSPYIGCYEGTPITFFSETAVSTDANTLANWNSERDGSTGSSPGAFTTANYVFIVQNGHTCLPTATWTGSSTGFVLVESGGGLDLNAKTLSTWGSIKIVGSGVSSTGALFNSSSSASLSIPIILIGNATISSSGSSGLTLTGGITGTGYALTIDGSYSTTISTSGINTSTAGTLIKSGSGTLTISVSGDFTGATTISAGVVNIQHATALGTTTSGTTVASGAALQIQGGITLGAEALTLNNDGISSMGSLRNISGNNTYGGNITLSGNNVRINSDLNTLTLLGTITNSTLNLTIGGAGSVTANGVIGSGAGNLTYDGSGTLVLGATNTYTGTTTISSGTVNLGANQTLSNNLTNSGTLDITASNYSLSLTGNFTNNGAFISRSGAVTFNGGSAQTISGITDPNFYNFTLNNASGAIISLNTTVQGTFTFTSGKFTTQGYTLTIGTNETNGSVLGYTSSNYFIAYKNGVVATGSLKQFINSKSSVANANVYVYPIGDLTNYTPFTITINSASTLAAGAYFTMYTNASKISGLNSSITTYLTRYWSGTDSGITTPNYDIAYAYSASDVIAGTEANLRPVKKSGTTWYKPTGSTFTTGTAVGTGGLTLGTRTLTWSGLTSFSDYGGVGPAAVGLPIELIKFSVKKVGSDNMISWETQTENNNDYFTVERTLDGIWFEIVGNQKGSGNSYNLINYSLKDTDFPKTVNYYRLKQTDFNGNSIFSDLISIDNRELIYKEKIIVNEFNVLGQEIDENYTGFVIVLYSDGTTSKILK